MEFDHLTLKQGMDVTDIDIIVQYQVNSRGMGVWEV